VAGPPPNRPVWWWPSHPSGLRGWPDHPLLKRRKKKKNVKEEGWHRGWSGHPLRPLGWLGHHQTGRSGGGPATLVADHPLCHPSSFTFFFFFFFFFFVSFSLTVGGPATPLGHWGGSQWPKGVVEPPLMPPFFFHVFFFFFFFFSLFNRGWFGQATLVA
jgi:hypothetical protein